MGYKIHKTKRLNLQPGVDTPFNIASCTFLLIKNRENPMTTDVINPAWVSTEGPAGENDDSSSIETGAIMGIDGGGGDNFIHFMSPAGTTLELVVSY